MPCEWQPPGKGLGRDSTTAWRSSAATSAGRDSRSPWKCSAPHDRGAGWRASASVTFAKSSLQPPGPIQFELDTQGRRLLMSLLVVGSLAFDSVETPHGI